MTEEPTQKQEAADTQTVLQIREVTLAGQARSFKIKSIGETHEFRRRVGQLVGTFVKPLYDAYMEAEAKTRVQGKADAKAKPEDWVDKLDVQALSAQLLPLLLGEGVDALVDMLWTYAPELKEFEADATDDEILDAALEVLEIAFPLVLKIGKRTVALWSRVGKKLK